MNMLDLLEQDGKMHLDFDSQKEAYDAAVEIRQNLSKEGIDHLVSVKASGVRVRIFKTESVPV